MCVLLIRIIFTAYYKMFKKLSQVVLWLLQGCVCDTRLAKDTLKGSFLGGNVLV